MPTVTVAELCGRQTAELITGVGQEAELTCLTERDKHDRVAEIAEKTRRKFLAELLLRKLSDRSRKKHRADAGRQSRTPRVNHRRHIRRFLEA